MQTISLVLENENLLPYVDFIQQRMQEWHRSCAWKGVYVNTTTENAFYSEGDQLEAATDGNVNPTIREIAW